MATLSLTGNEVGHLWISDQANDRRERFRYALVIIGSGLLRRNTELGVSREELGIGVKEGRGRVGKG